MEYQTWGWYRTDDKNKYEHTFTVDCSPNHKLDTAYVVVRVQGDQQQARRLADEIRDLLNLRAEAAEKAEKEITLAAAVAQRMTK